MFEAIKQWLKRNRKGKGETCVEWIYIYIYFKGETGKDTAKKIS